jgi:hypothetical protein
LSKDPTSAAENKCLGRRNVACNSVAFLQLEEYAGGTRQSGWCFPQCGSDEDCSGRSCDLARGLCTDTPATGAALGSPCETGDDCSGNLCVAVGPDDRFCSASCVFGQPVGCGYGLNASPRDASCFAPRVRGFLDSEGDGDVGLCIELCDVDSDCTQFAAGNWQCVRSADALGRFGRGVCNIVDAAGGADAGDAGNSDAGNNNVSNGDAGNGDAG